MTSTTKTITVVSDSLQSSAIGDSAVACTAVEHQGRSRGRGKPRRATKAAAKPQGASPPLSTAQVGGSQATPSTRASRRARRKDVATVSTDPEDAGACTTPSTALAASGVCASPVPSGVEAVTDASEFELCSPYESFIARRVKEGLEGLEPEKYNEQFISHVIGELPDPAATVRSYANFCPDMGLSFASCSQSKQRLGLRELPRSLNRPHGVLHDLRDHLLMQLFAYAVVNELDIFDAGGCRKRWLPVLGVFARLKLLLNIRLPRIWVNQPTLPNSPIYGTTQDQGYRRQDQHAEMEFPEVFLPGCGCIHTNRLCEHVYGQGQLVVAIDSAYYFPLAIGNASLPHLFTLSHHYRLAKGKLAQEMAWTTYDDGNLAVCLDQQFDVSYIHIPLPERHIQTPEYLSVATRMASGSPFGTLHAYSVLKWVNEKGIVVEADQPLGCVFTVQQNDQREGAAADFTISSNAVEVIETPACRVHIPQGAIASMLNFGGKRETEIDRAIWQSVNSCAAMDPSMAPAAVAYLKQHYADAIHDARAAVVGAQFRKTVMEVVLSVYVAIVLVMYTIFAERVQSPLLLPALVALGIVIFCAGRSKHTLGHGAPHSRPHPNILVGHQMYGQYWARRAYESFTGLFDTWYLRAYVACSAYSTYLRADLTAQKMYLPSIPNPCRGLLDAFFLCFTFCAVLAVCMLQTWEALFVCFVVIGLWSVAVQVSRCVGGLPSRWTSGEPMSLLHHAWRVFVPAPLVKFRWTKWIVDLATLVGNYACLAGGDDVASFTRHSADMSAVMAVSEAAGYSLTNSVNKYVQDDPDHAEFYSCFPVPMQSAKGFPISVMVMKIGRFLTRAHSSVRQLPEKYRLGRLRDLALCYKAYYGDVPIIRAFVDLWLRVTNTARRKTIPAHLRSEWVLRMERFCVRPESTPMCCDATLEWVTKQYGYQFTIDELLDFENAIRECPYPEDGVIHHPVASIIIKQDTELEVPVAPTRLWSYAAGALLEEAVALFLSTISGPLAPLFALAIGLLETALTSNYFLLAQHIIQALGYVYLGHTPVVLAHFAYNRFGVRNYYRSYSHYSPVDPDTGAPRGRLCLRGRPFQLPPLDSTFEMVVTRGCRTLMEIVPTADLTLEPVGEHHGRVLWGYVVTMRPPVANFATPTDLRVIDGIECEEHSHNAPAPQFIGPGCMDKFVSFTSRCAANGMRALLLRRALARPMPTPVGMQLQKLVIEICHPLRLALRDYHKLKWSMEERFDWWVNRPGVYPANRRVDFTRAFHTLLQQGSTMKKLHVSKTFNKTQLEVKEIPKPRGISALSDELSSLRGPTVQLVAKKVGKLLAPGVYKNLPECIHRVDLVWAKGANPVDLAEISAAVRGHFQHADCTDASAYDKNHWEPILRAADLAWDFYPPWVRRLLKDRQFVSKVMYPTDAEPIKVKSKFEASILTGEPDVSLKNTIIRFADDMLAHAAKDVGANQAPEARCLMFRAVDHEGRPCPLPPRI